MCVCVLGGGGGGKGEGGGILPNTPGIHHTLNDNQISALFFFIIVLTAVLFTFCIVPLKLVFFLTVCVFGSCMVQIRLFVCF